MSADNSCSASLRTHAEILEEIQSREGNFLDFTAEVLIEFLPFEVARPLLKSDIKPSEWPEPVPLTREAVVAKMRDYMREYGWDKALNHRGLSADRTIQKMRAWAWVLRDDVSYFTDDNYPQYGVPILKTVCETYGFDIPSDSRVERMAKGLPCGDYDGECGCGR